MIDLGIAQRVDDFERGPIYVVDPAEAYPMTLEHIEQRIANDQCPPEPFVGLYEKAKEVDGECWQYIGVHPNDTPEEYLDGRAILLEVARLWFTELLHQAHGGGGMGVKLLNRPDFKLYGDPTIGEKKDRTILRALGLRISRA